MKSLKLNKLTLIGVAFGLTLFATSCMNGGEAGSCLDNNFCTDYIGADHEADTVKSACLGTYSTDACSSANSSGSCLVSSGQADETKITYYSAGFDASAARSQCDSAGGTFN